MNPIRFGSREPQLLGMFHPAEVQTGSVRGVLICNPFGLEAIRGHRMFKVLADRLSHEGANVLRFDYFGTGDSPGDDMEIDIGRWIEDINEAHQELQQRCGASNLTWIGARLGATASAIASATAMSAPQRLVLWEPIVSGRDYLQLLAQRHAEYLFATLGRVRGAVPSDGEVREALGFALPPTWVHQIESITMESLKGTRAEETIIVAPRTTLAAFRSAWSKSAGHVAMHEFDAPFDWSSEEAWNSALVPAPALQLLASIAKGSA